MYTILSTQISLWEKIQQASVHEQGYEIALYNVNEYLDDFERDEERKIIKTNNSLRLLIWEYGEIELIQEWVEWDITSQLTDEWEILWVF